LGMDGGAEGGGCSSAVVASEAGGGGAAGAVWDGPEAEQRGLGAVWEGSEGETGWLQRGVGQPALDARETELVLVRREARLASATDPGLRRRRELPLVVPRWALEAHGGPAYAHALAPPTETRAGLLRQTDAAGNSVRDLMLGSSALQVREQAARASGASKRREQAARASGASKRREQAARASGASKRREQAVGPWPTEPILSATASALETPLLPPLPFIAIRIGFPWLVSRGPSRRFGRARQGTAGHARSRQGTAGHGRSRQDIA
jgi:hypothetical protein